MRRFSPVFSKLRAAELRVQGRAMWARPCSTPGLFSRRAGVFLPRLLRKAAQLERKEAASPRVEAAMAPRQAASMLWGAKRQKKNTVAAMVRTCSKASDQAVDNDSSTARK